MVVGFKAIEIGGKNEEAIKYVVKDKTLELFDTRTIS